MNEEPPCYVNEIDEIGMYGPGRSWLERVCNGRPCTNPIQISELSGKVVTILCDCGCPTPPPSPALFQALIDQEAFKVPE